MIILVINNPLIYRKTHFKAKEIKEMHDFISLVVVPAIILSSIFGILLFYLFKKDNKSKTDAIKFNRSFDVKNVEHMSAYRSYISYGTPLNFGGVEINEYSENYLKDRMYLAWVEYVANGYEEQTTISR